MLDIQEKLEHDTGWLWFYGFNHDEKEKEMFTSLRPMPSIKKKDEISFKKMGKYLLTCIIWE
jgi:hypothetical protein